jgi:hypothetical protein
VPILAELGPREAAALILANREPLEEPAAVALQVAALTELVGELVGRVEELEARRRR